jgi:hypothetical protein
VLCFERGQKVSSIGVTDVLRRVWALGTPTSIAEWFEKEESEKRGACATLEAVRYGPGGTRVGHGRAKQRE